MSTLTLSPRDIAAAKLYRRRRLTNIIAIGLACAAAIFGLGGVKARV